MSDNKQRLGTSQRQERDWDDNSRNNEFERNQGQGNRRQFEQPGEPQLYRGGYQPENYGSSYQNTPNRQNQNWNNDQEWNNQQETFSSQRNQMNHGNNDAQHYGSNFGSRDNNFGGRNQYGNSSNPGEQQYGSSQRLQQPGSNFTGNFNNYNPGRWNEGYHRNPAQDFNNRQTMQGGSLSGNYPDTSNWQSRNEGNMHINESGSLNSNSGQHRGKGPKGYQRSDDRIREDVCDCLTDDMHLDASNIEVEVDSNQVILSGSVDSRESKRRAEELVESISGVNNVENRLHVSKDKSNNSNSSSSSSSQQSSTNNHDSKHKKGSLSNASMQ